MLLKLSNLNSNLALTLGYLNPALKNPTLVLTRGFPGDAQVKDKELEKTEKY